MNKLRLVLVQKFQSHTILHLGLGNAFGRVYYSVSDSTSNNFLYVSLFGECEAYMGWFFTNFFYTLRAKEKNKNSLYEVANKEIRQVKPSKKDLKNMANFKI